MAESNIAEYSAKTIKGAERCMAALRAMESVVAAGGPEWKDVWASEKIASDVLITASGVDTPFLRGFVSVLAEYVNMCNSCGAPDLLVWKPDAALTEEELQASRQEMIAVI